MSYDDAVAYVSSLEGRGWRLGLDRMGELARRAGLDDALGESPGSPRFLHVAGTNGKGSVTAYIQSILKEAGRRVGGYFSPYVYDVRERIQVDAAPIERASFAALVENLRPIADGFDGSEFGQVTEFEFKTAMGLLAWKRSECEYVAFEVGMGGRLDATNIVTPACSVIVSIGLDHTQYLGETLAEIAREKAGIIKLGRPVVMGQLAVEAAVEVERIAAENQSTLWRVGAEIQVEGTHENLTIATPSRSLENLRPSLYGAHQSENLALAVAALDAAGIAVDADAFRSGALSTRLPGRFELREVGGVRIVLDGAHNSEAAQALASSFESCFPGKRAVLLVGRVGGHDSEAFFRELVGIARRAHAAPIDFHRAIGPDEVALAARRAGIEAIAHGTLDTAIEGALADCGRDDVLLVTGSFYLVGAVGNSLWPQA